MPVKPIPDGYHSVTPYLIVKGAARALAFYREAFGAEELYRMEAPGGRIGHAEMKIGDSPVMLADEHPEMGYLGPEPPRHSPVSFMIYVPDVDAVFARAIAAGAKQERAVADQFYGDRNGVLVDPFGHRWTVATHVEDVSSEEVEKRAVAAGRKAEA
jgi:PhnB protein